MKQLHIKLGDILKERNMTQGQLAELAGIRPAAVSEIVNNQRTSINKDHLTKIADTLDIDDISELMVFVEKVTR